MWGLILTLLVITIALAIIGFSAAIAVLKILFWIFLGLTLIAVIARLIGGPRPIAT